MKHAAQKAPKSAAGRLGMLSGVFSSRSSSQAHPVHAAHAISGDMRGLAVESNGSGTAGAAAELFLDEASAGQTNASRPMTRTERRVARKAKARRSHIVTSVSLAALVGMTTSASMALASKPKETATPERGETTESIRPSDSAAASRSSNRVSLPGANVDGETAQTRSDGTWQLDQSASVDVGQLSKSTANNPVVARLMDSDKGQIPAGFNPNHPTGDSGNGYEFSQCTWWAYVRRHQLGLPVGSQMGNGNMWGNSARAMGYWVDSTARHVGDVMVFAAGQDGADATYGHVAIIEKINADGSVQTSESGSVMNGKTYSRTYSAAQVARHDIIHY